MIELLHWRERCALAYALFEWRQHCPRAVRARRICEAEVAMTTGASLEDIYDQTIQRHHAFLKGILR